MSSDASPADAVATFVPVWHTGRGTMQVAIKQGRASGHTVFAGKDISEKGVKSWASFPTHHDFYQHVVSTQTGRRHFYELITESTKVCLWMDVEWRALSKNADDAENRRAKLEEVVRKAVSASFGVEDPCIFFGISTRETHGKTEVKHSYQVRIPSVVFPTNEKDGALARWVQQFIAQTKDEPLFQCPISQKHIVDAAVYSRTRCVRACFCSKQNDGTKTPLRVMFDHGAATLPGLVESGGLSEFEAMMVDASVKRYDAFQTVHIQANATIRCMGISASSGNVFGAIQDGVFGNAGAATQASITEAGLEGSGKRSSLAVDEGAGRSKRPRQNLSGNGGAQSDLSGEVIDCLALLGSDHAESYEKWVQVMFAVRNCGEPQVCKMAFAEWSKRAGSFTNDLDVATQLQNTDRRVRVDGRPALGLASLRRAIQSDPFLVFKSERVHVDGHNTETLEWSTFLSNVDLQKTAWRCIVRAARLLWPHRRSDVIQDLTAKLRLVHLDIDVDRVGGVWDLSHCTCRRFVDAVASHIKQQLLWPELVTRTLPMLLGEFDGRVYTASAYTCDNAYSLEVVLQDKVSDEPFSIKYKVRLATGEVAASGVNLMERAFMFDSRSPTELLPDYSPDSQVNWGKRVAEIPEIVNNVHYVNEHCWCVYNEASGIWDEIPIKTPHMQQYVSDVVRSHFRPLLSFLDFKSGFDAVADAQRVKLLRIMARFANHEFLDHVLSAIQAHPKIWVADFNEKFDVQPHLLACENGILDLLTMVLRPISRDDYITHKIDIPWDPSVCTAGALEFLRSMWPLDTDAIVPCIVNWLAYCITGFTNLQICVYMIGWGSNGKSKLSFVMEKVLGSKSFAHITYEALCAKANQPNEDIYNARHARLWQVDENNTDHQLNFALIKRITGQDGMTVRRLYGHQVKIPPRAKLNFAVNSAPKLTESKDHKELRSLSRRFVYINCPAQFVDFGENSKDCKQIEKLRVEMTKDQFAKCVKQLDNNLDQKLENMVPAFLKLFADAAHALIDVDAKGKPVFKMFEIPHCIQQDMDRMMFCNPSLKADEFLNAMYEPGVSGDVLLREMFTTFLNAYDVAEHNFSLSRFEKDLDKWIAQQNATHPNCRHNNLLVKKNKILRGSRKGEILLKNIAEYMGRDE